MACLVSVDFAGRAGGSDRNQDTSQDTYSGSGTGNSPKQQISIEARLIEFDPDHCI